jgi:glycosyltransferase involved in cell wall biosynthesis
MDKILTIAIPSYNADWCLEKCLHSLIDERVLDRLDIIVINDGSTDRTLEIARRYEEEYPGVFRVCDKPNGGHGSGINAGIDLASGHFFKVIDSDDWVITDNLVKLVDILASASADIVLANFHTVDMLTGRRQPFSTKGIPTGVPCTIDELIRAGRGALECSTFHGIIYRTDFYRQSNVRMTEKVFFEDQEYATLPFKAAKTILPLDLYLYEYLIGNTEQSVSDKSQVRRIGHIEQVLWSIADCLRSNPTMPEANQQYFIRKLSDVLLSYYVVALVKNPDKKAGRLDVKRLRRDLAVHHGPLVKLTNKKYLLALLMNYLHISNRTLEFLKRSALYKTLYNAVRRK